MARQRRSSEFSERMCLLWKDYFGDPSLWYDNRSSKYNSRSPDFRHRITCETLWMDGWYNPSWVLEELKRREDLFLSTHEELKLKEINNEGITFVSLLKVCAQRKDLCKGTELHADIVKKGLLEKSPYLASALINMYAKCGVLSKAQQVLDELPVCDLISWNAIISGYAQSGQGQEALICYKKMQKQGLSPDAVTFICILKACGSSRSIVEGKRIHEEIVNRGFLDNDIVLGTALVDMYAKCGMLTQAQQVLEELQGRNVVSWNALISGYAQQGQFHEALDCFERMRSEGIFPNRVTFICILKACGSVGAVVKGEEIHDEIMNMSFLENDNVIGTALVDMYAKCGQLIKAQKTFEELSARNAISWSALIAGYAEQGHGYEALNCFEQMQSEGFSPDVVTFISLLKACGSVGAVSKGKQIHDEIVSRVLLKNHIVLGNALVDMYAKCGMLAKAEQVLKQLPIRVVASWNALISVYSQHGQGDEALKCFEWMQQEGLAPDETTFVCLLRACASTGAINKGEKIYDDIVSRGLLEKNVLVGTALVDMYAKCGALAKAQQTLEELPMRDVVSWNALIGGYAQQGRGHRAMDCFTRMRNEGLSPNAVTFLCVISACNYSGRLDDAQTYFENLTRAYGIIPNLEHHTCMVAAFGYAGHFDKALSVIRAMPCSHYPVLWLALLRACREWGNVKLAIFAFDQTVELDSSCAAAYVLMSNIFISVGMQEDAEKVRLQYAAVLRSGDM